MHPEGVGSGATENSKEQKRSDMYVVGQFWEQATKRMAGAVSYILTVPA